MKFQKNNREYVFFVYMHYHFKKFNFHRFKNNKGELFSMTFIFTVYNLHNSCSYYYVHKCLHNYVHTCDIFSAFVKCDPWLKLSLSQTLFTIIETKVIISKITK